MIDIKNLEINQYPSKLKKYRISQGLTQHGLADLSGVNIKSITLYEQKPETINKASVSTVSALAECCNCSIEDLLYK